MTTDIMTDEVVVKVLPEVKPSMVTILRPDFVHRTNSGHYITPMMRDYILVPRLSTYGVFPISGMMSMESLAKLARIRDSLAGVKRRR